MDALQKKHLLADLATVFKHPYLVDQCSRKSSAETLYGLGKWMRRDRRCKVCKRRLPAAREKCCSEKCFKQWRSRLRDAGKRRRGLARWPDFRDSVKAVIPIADLAEKQGISEAEARSQAELMCARGSLKAWRGPAGGAIREIGIPIKQAEAGR
jgi:hypothetical protein